MPQKWNISRKTATPLQQCLEGTIKQMASSRVIFLYWCYCGAPCYDNRRSCTLWSWRRVEGGRTLKLLFGTSPAPAAAARLVPAPCQLAAARVFIQRGGESRVPCSTKATSGTFPVNHCSLRRLAAIPGPPEGWSHCLLRGVRIKSCGALFLEPGKTASQGRACRWPNQACDSVLWDQTGKRSLQGRKEETARYIQIIWDGFHNKTCKARRDDMAPGPQRTWF